MMIEMFVDFEYSLEDGEDTLQYYYEELTIEGSHPAILRALQYMVDELAELGWDVEAGCTESRSEDDGYFPYYYIEPGYHQRTGKVKPLVW